MVGSSNDCQLRGNKGERKWGDIKGVWDMALNSHNHPLLVSHCHGVVSQQECLARVQSPRAPLQIPPQTTHLAAVTPFCRTLGVGFPTPSFP